MKEITKQLLFQLKEVLEKMEPTDYHKELDYLSGSTVGKHVRHILDFYLCLIRSRNNEILSYDKRNRDLDVETEVKAAIHLIEAIALDLEDVDLNKKIVLSQTFGSELFEVESSILRELSYNLEHSIHHMAIIKIALKQSFKYIEVDQNFGVAFSTISYNNSKG